MRLFASPTSPYARKVLVLAHEADLADRIEVVHTNPFEQDAALVQANPLSKVPTLVVGDDVWYDSRVICEYLDGLHERTRFFPPSGRARWAALRAQALADGMLDAAVAWRLESLRPDTQRSEDTEARYQRAIRRGLSAMSGTLPSMRAEPTIAHIAFGCVLGYLDLRFAEEAWRGEHEDLARWFTAWANRPSMVDTAHPHA